MIRNLLNKTASTITTLMDPVHTMMRDVYVTPYYDDDADQRHTTEYVEKIFSDHLSDDRKPDNWDSKPNLPLAGTIISGLDSSRLRKPIVIRNLTMDHIAFQDCDLSNITFADCDMRGIAFDDSCKNPPHIEHSCDVDGIFFPDQWLRAPFIFDTETMKNISLSSPSPASPSLTYQAINVQPDAIIPGQTDDTVVLREINGQIDVELPANAVTQPIPRRDEAFDTRPAPHAFVSAALQYPATMNGMHISISGKELIERLQQDFENPIQPYVPSLDRRMDMHQLWLATDHKQGTQLDISGEVIRNVNIQGRDLKDAKIQETTFENCGIDDVSFQGCDMTNVTFDSCDIERLNLSDTSSRGLVMTHTTARSLTMEDATLEHALIENTALLAPSFDGSALTGTRFANCDIEGVSWENDPRVIQASFMAADLSGVQIEHSTIANANFVDAIAGLIEGRDHTIDFTDTTLERVAMYNTDLRGANFDHVTIHSSDLVDTDMSRSNIQMMRMDSDTVHNLDLTGATVFDAKFEKLTTLPNRSTSSPDIRFDDATLQDSDVSIFQRRPINISANNVTLVDATIPRSLLRDYPEQIEALPAHVDEKDSPEDDKDLDFQ